MNTLRLTDEQLALTRHALYAYLQAFGHREADTVEEIKSVLATVDAAVRHRLSRSTHA